MTLVIVLCPFDREWGVVNSKLVKHDGLQEQLPQFNVSTATATLKSTLQSLGSILSMTFIEISDLTTVANESLVGTDSFLNELQTTKTTQIFGGWRGGGRYEKCWKKEDYNWKKENYNWKKDDCGWKKEEKYESKHNSGWKKKC